MLAPLSLDGDWQLRELSLSAGAGQQSRNDGASVRARRSSLEPIKLVRSCAVLSDGACLGGLKLCSLSPRLIVAGVLQAEEGFGSSG